ncbi:MAG: hypothetical protein ABR579_05125 [Actinomycetota bacterium]
MTRLRALCAFAVIAGALWIPASAGPACASGPHAGLVVDTGNRVLRYCVALPSPSVSGGKLIELAGDQYGLEYRFGSGGGAVCRLAGVGPDGSDCFADYPNYWGYWRGTSDGGWTWSSSGATSTTVSDGDVDGWAWGSGDDGSTHPKPPASTFASVCASALAAKSTPPRTTAAAPPPSLAATTAAPVISPPPARPHYRSKKAHHKHLHGRKHHGQDPGSVVTLAPSPVAAPIPSSGPPVAGIAGVALVGTLGIVGFAITRSRRSAG